MSNVTIAFMNIKGGVGKSCIAGQCARELSRLGYKLGFKDTDPQQSFALFAKNNQGYFQGDGTDNDFMIVDTEGGLNDSFRYTVESVLKTNGYIFIPLRATQIDVDVALQTLVELRHYKVDDRALFVINQARHSDRNSVIAVKNELAKYARVAKTTLGFRSAYNTEPSPIVKQEISSLLHESGVASARSFKE